MQYRLSRANKLFYFIICLILADLSCVLTSTQPIMSQGSGSEETKVYLQKQTTADIEQQPTTTSTIEQPVDVEEKPTATLSPEQLSTLIPATPSLNTTPSLSYEDLPSPLPAGTDTSEETPVYKKPIFSVSRFGCLTEGVPEMVTITLQGENMPPMAIYYRLVEKKTNKTSDWLIKDMVRNIEGRTVTLNIKKDVVNPLQFTEAWLQYLIISDDGSYRSPIYEDITALPCP